eukprot:6383380-Amphidinium_carterae.1
MLEANGAFPSKPQNCRKRVGEVCNDCAAIALTCQWAVAAPGAGEWQQHWASRSLPPQRDDRSMLAKHRTKAQ